MRPACLALALLLASRAAAAAGLPQAVERALQQADVPEQALAAVVVDLARHRTVLARHAHRPQNPASLTKLFTTAASLDLLGPAWTWSTPVWLQGAVRDGVLDGSVYIKGSGDPKLVLERVWLLLRQVQQRGVGDIRGDIVLDDSAFQVPPVDPAAFDGEPTRPYNVQPSALLLNYKSVTYTFVPDAAAGVARVLVEPALAGISVQPSVPLARGPCVDWRAGLQARFGDSVSFAGRYATACGEQAWPVADPQPARYNARLVQALWQSMGGRLGGSVHEGRALDGLAPSFVWHSPPLAEVVRDINKYSNNLMAQQLFYTLDAVRHPERAATDDGARQTLRRWLDERLAPAPGELNLDNGSGLSRDTRVSAAVLAQLLEWVFGSPVMPELMASLPIAGVDGTMRHSPIPPGRAHLKTGSLRGVAALAGYVISGTGRRYVVVALLQHPNADAARPALDALVQWVMNDAAAP